MIICDKLESKVLYSCANQIGERSHTVDSISNPFKDNKCHKGYVNIDASYCYSDPGEINSRYKHRTTDGRVNGYYAYVYETNGYYLTKFGWCKNDNNNSNTFNSTKIEDISKNDRKN